MYFFHDLQKGICQSRKAPLFISLSRFSEVRCLPWSCALFSQTQTMFLFKYKYSAPLPIFQNTNHFKYKYSAPLLILRNTNYLFKCVLRLLVLLPLRSNKFLTAICWDFSATSSLNVEFISEWSVLGINPIVSQILENEMTALYFKSMQHNSLNTDVHIRYNQIRLASHGI